MSRNLRRGALAAALAFSLAPLTACAAGDDAPTLGVRPDNAATTMGDIKVQNAVIITAVGDPGAAVSARIFNSGDSAQTIDSVTVGGSVAAELTAPITVPAGGSVLLGGEGNPSVTLPNRAEAAPDGSFQEVALDFSETGEVVVQANVVPATGYYESYGPSAAPAPSAPSTPAATETVSGTAETSGTEDDTTTPDASVSSTGAVAN